MNARKLLGIIMLVGLLSTIPSAYAKPDKRGLEMSITLDQVTVFDYNGDGLKDSARVQGTGNVQTSGDPFTAGVVIVYRLKYLTDPSQHPNSWVFVSTAHQFKATRGGYDNSFDYTFTSLPYPGWYSVSAVAYFRGEISFSNTLNFDPPGGEGGPGGYD